MKIDLTASQIVQSMKSLFYLIGSVIVSVTIAVILNKITAVQYVNSLKWAITAYTGAYTVYKTTKAITEKSK